MATPVPAILDDAAQIRVSFVGRQTACGAVFGKALADLTGLRRQVVGRDLHGAPHNFSLRDVPRARQFPEPPKCGLVEREACSMFGSAHAVIMFGNYRTVNSVAQRLALRNPRQKRYEVGRLDRKHHAHQTTSTGRCGYRRMLVDYVKISSHIESMEVVNVHDAKTRFSPLLAREHAGEEIIPAKGGVPWARLVPLEETNERHPGRYRSEDVPESFFEDLPDEEHEAWEK